MLLPLEFADIVVDRVRPDRLAVAADRDDEHFDVDEGSVPARATSDDMDVTLLPRLLIEPGGFGTDFHRIRDEIVDVATDCLLPRVAEERLGRGVPGDDLVSEVDFGNRRWTVLQEGLKVMLLPLEFADIVVDRVRPARLAVAADWDDEHLDVDERAVLAHPPGDAMGRSFGDRFFHDRRTLLSERLGLENELLDRPPERLRRRVPEQRFGCGVPRRHALLEIQSDDRDWTDLEQRLDVLLLAAELLLAPVERILQLLPLRDVEKKAVMEDRLTRLVAHHPRLVQEPADAPVARNHAVFHGEKVPRLARSPVLGKDAFTVVRMDDLQEVLSVRSPLLGRIAQHGLELRTHEDVGADVVEPVDVDRDRNLLDQRPKSLSGGERARQSLRLIHRPAPTMSRQPPLESLKPA